MSDHPDLTAKSPLRFLPVYFTGFFSLSLQPMIAFLVPLWAISIDASPLWLGVAVSAGSVIPALLAISSGALIDRVGAGKLLAYGPLLIALLAFLYPLSPTIFALVLLQLLFGQIQTTNWIAAQTYVGRLSKGVGNASHASYFGFAVNLGVFLGPLLLGFLWDVFSPHAAFFAVSGWALCLWISSRLLPREDEDGEVAGGVEEKQKTDWEVFLPRWRDYRAAFSLLAIPMVALIVYGTFLRLSGFAMQSSFYLVYLARLEFSATAMSILYAVLPLSGVFSSLCVGWFTRAVKESYLLFGAVVIGILPLILTPLFDDLWLLLLLGAVSGFGLGMTLPLLISMLSGAVERDRQGLAVGLRTTANRIASAVVPSLFGLMVAGVGLESAFYAIGALLLLPMIVVVPLLQKRVVTIGEREENL